MKIIRATGGSGSSFLAKRFEELGWYVCLRPDGGHQKFSKTKEQIFAARTKSFFSSEGIVDGVTQKEMFDVCYSNLQSFRHVEKTMLLCMTWGGLGYLNGLPEETIYLIRDPIFAFNSYSGGGWRAEGGKRRIAYLGATGPDDRKWIDLWLNDFALWKKGAENALRDYKDGLGHIVRYHSFAEDWGKLEGLPPVHRGYEPKDNIEKVISFLREETISYIREQTDDLWNEIKEL